VANLGEPGASLDDEMLEQLMEIRKLMSRLVESARTEKKETETQKKQQQIQETTKEKRESKEQSYIRQETRNIKKKETDKSFEEKKKEFGAMRSTLLSVGLGGIYGGLRAGVNYLDYTKTGLEKRQSAVGQGFQAGGAGVGLAIGGALGGPFGAAIGASIGKEVGSLLGDVFSKLTQKERVAEVETKSDLERMYLSLGESGAVPLHEIQRMALEDVSAIKAAKLRREETREALVEIASMGNEEINEMKNLINTNPGMYLLAEKFK